ncbi:3' exoribonuclease family, domain 1 domain-containing protein [Ditylenchus destructor]|nr:3' exoribonuclease family, domain 1 domain-containing protein [Ditylenchus destructor]
MDVPLSMQEKNYIIDGASDGIRNDGRGLFDYRPIVLETGVLSSTNGSARVRIDTTDVLVGIKAEMTAVDDSSCCANRLKFFVDCSAIASPKFAGRGGSEFGEEIARTLYTAYDHDDVLPQMKKLVLGQTFMWTINVDIVILQFGGNVLDAVSLAVKAALADTEICEVIVRPADEGKIMLDLPDETHTWTFDISSVPLVIGICRIGEQNVIDPTEIEEACASSSLFVSVVVPARNTSSKTTLDDQCHLTCVRKSKGGSLEVESIQDMISAAVRSARNLNVALEARLKQESNEKNSKHNQSLKSFLR